jgi:hypothetical protein
VLDVAYALIVEGMTPDQRAEFDRLLAAETGEADSADTAQRRAYALAHGEQR